MGRISQNELNDAVNEQLNKTSDIGDKTQLQTTNKTDLVSATNEVVATVAIHQVDYVRQPAYGPATGLVNAYTFSAMTATALIDGMSVYLDNVIATNTGASTLNWSGLGAIPIKDAKGQALIAGKMPLNGIIGLRYNASVPSFQLLGEGGEYGTALNSDVRSTKTVGTANGVVQGTLDLANVIATNIRNGITIDGVTGTVIEGKRSASGPGVATFNGESMNLVVTGLNFRPKVIEIVSSSSGVPNWNEFYTYRGDLAGETFARRFSQPSSFGVEVSVGITSSGFNVYVQNTNYFWKAYEE